MSYDASHRPHRLAVLSLAFLAALAVTSPRASATNDLRVEFRAGHGREAVIPVRAHRGGMLRIRAHFRSRSTASMEMQLVGVLRCGRSIVLDRDLEIGRSGRLEICKRLSRFRLRSFCRLEVRLSNRCNGVARGRVHISRGPMIRRRPH